MKQYCTKQLKVSFRGAFLVILLAVILFSTVQPTPVSAEGCTVGNCLFLPVLRSPASGDLAIYGIEVTQAVQDPQNSVPLVAGRNTLLRIYARTLEKDTPLSNVKISVTATSNGNNMNESPRIFTASIPLNYDRGTMKGSINVTLPPSWTSGNVSLTVRLDPENKIGETSESNNSLTKQFAFQSVAPLRIKIVPIQYVSTKDGYIYPAPTRDSISSWVSRTYPVPAVEVTWHAPYTFTGNLSLSSEFSRLLNLVTALRSSEGTPSDVVYYALVPITTEGHTWFYGGVAGIGWIGLRAAVGLDLATTSGQIAAHEIGHNFGLDHSPCGTLVGSDTNYPYLDGSIGQLGTDTVEGTIYPSTTKDVMSYCSPKWVSDYTYKALFSTQRLVGGLYSASAEVQSQRGLLVRAEISETGVDLKPAYVLPETITSLPEAGEYLLETLDDQGGVLTQTPLRAYEAVNEEGVQLTSINAMAPLPDTPVASFRLVKDGQVIASQPLQMAVPEGFAAQAESPVKAQIALVELSAALAQTAQPALVRYSTDGGATWSTLGLDLSADGVPALPDENAIYQVVESGTWQ